MKSMTPQNVNYTMCTSSYHSKGHQKCSIIEKQEREETVGGSLHNHLHFVCFFVYIR